MIKTVTKVALPIDESLSIKKNRIVSDDGNRQKRFSLVTGIHGDELEGQYICYLVVKKLKDHPELFHGIVDVYPAMNPLGIESIIRGIPDFDLDMNRLFPGRTDGDMNEFVASQIVEDLEGSDLCVDIHASNMYLWEVPQIRINELTAEKLVPIAMESNVDFVWVHGAATVLESTLAHSLNMRGVNTLVIETGIGMRITKNYCEQIAGGIFRMMRRMGMWDGDVDESKTPVLSSDPSEVAFLNAPMSGILVSTAKHGDKVKKGQEIGLIVSPMEGSVLHTVTAPCDGWLFTLREYPVVTEGSLMARILKDREL